MEKIKIGIFGMGRMGLTHFAILNQLLNNADFIFIDPDKKISFFTKKNLNVKILSSAKQLDEPLDYALICTPPMFHIPILEKCIEGEYTNIFVEKPFGGINDNFSTVMNSNYDISVGYVLRFNPIVNWIKTNLDVKNVEKVDCFYFSNTIEKKPKGWRNGPYSGVTNEVGAHIIDLCIYLFELSNPHVISNKKDSIISDLDDILIATLEDNSITYHFHFDWVNKEYRKPVFKFNITLKDGTLIKFDQQKVEFFNYNKLVNRISVVDLAQKVPFYLRGVEFTSQMEDFIGSKNTLTNLKEALISRNIIQKLINQ